MGTVAAGTYATAFSALLSGLAAVGQTLVVVSRFADKVARVTALVTEIVALIVNTKIDSQRRRTAN
jgi:hypothetical protein